MIPIILRAVRPAEAVYLRQAAVSEAAAFHPEAMDLPAGDLHDAHRRPARVLREAHADRFRPFVRQRAHAGRFRPVVPRPDRACGVDAFHRTASAVL